jgi:hypothetical protein
MANKIVYNSKYLTDCKIAFLCCSSKPDTKNLIYEYSKSKREVSDDKPQQKYF